MNQVLKRSKFKVTQRHQEIKHITTRNKSSYVTVTQRSDSKSRLGSPFNQTGNSGMMSCGAGGEALWRHLLKRTKNRTVTVFIFLVMSTLESPYVLPCPRHLTWFSLVALFSRWLGPNTASAVEAWLCKTGVIFTFIWTFVGAFKGWRLEWHWKSKDSLCDLSIERRSRLSAWSAPRQRSRSKPEDVVFPKAKRSRFF